MLVPFLLLAANALTPSQGGSSWLQQQSCYGFRYVGQKILLHCFVSGIPCPIQKIQKNSSKFWVFSATASVKKILCLSSKVAIPWVQKFGHNIPCQIWWPQLQARLLAMLWSKIPVLQMSQQGLSGTVPWEETMSCTFRGPFIQPIHRAGFYISWGGNLTVLNLWPWGFTSDHAETLASPCVPFQSLQMDSRENITSKDNWCSGTGVHW